MRAGAIALPVALLLALGSPASAEPLRLRSDALVQTRSPVGLVVLQGQDELKPWLDAETVTWLGVTDTTNATGATGDVLTLSVRLRDLPTGSEVRAGRLIVATGAVRPIHIDGARATARSFGGTSVEAFGGFPVARRFEYRTFDWAAGGRVGQAIGDVVSFGGSYLHRRSDGNPYDEEAGADVAITPSRTFTAAGRAAFDLVTYGVTDALASVSAQKGDVRGELFTTHRSPGRLLPSTSLFSVLGDYAATSVGATARWRAAPRLELVATGSGQSQGGDLGGQGLGRATLALDDEWAGTVGAEARRVDFGTAKWTGARALVGVPVATRFRLASEIELVVPDEPRGRGVLWPWALVAFGVRPAAGWDAAAGVEASSGPEARREVHALLRLTYTFERARP